MINNDFIKNHTLLQCLQEFKGAAVGNSVKEREDSLKEPFSLLAKKMLYGGYYIVGNVFKIEIQIVEFYYHEENPIDNRICDYIVYHRNGNYPPGCGNEDLPYFPILSFHAHPSGIDITFENPNKNYRASALIRAYSLFDLKKQEYVTIKDEKGKPLKSYHTNKEFCAKTNIDDRSQYLYYYLNGFSIDGYENIIKWESIENVDYDSCMLYRGHRKNVFKQDENGIIIIDGNVSLDDREWAFSKRENTIIKHSRDESNDIKHPAKRFFQKEQYGIGQGHFIR